MMITKLALRDFRGFRDLEVSFAPRLTCILALNGIGKTSLIDALAAALGALAKGALNAQPKKPFLGLITELDHRREWLSSSLPEVVSPKVEIETHATWGDLEIAWQLHAQRVLRDGPARSDPRLVWLSSKHGLFDKLDAAARSESEPLPLLAVLSAQRWPRAEKTPLPQISAMDSVTAERLPRWVTQPFLNTEWYPLRDRWFEFSSRSAQGGERAARALKSAAGALGRALLNADEPNYNADAQDVLVQLPGEGVRPVGLMSDGWRAYVATIVALAFRCAEINPTSADAAAFTPGVLLIDEIEQHLHPHLQLRIVDDLRRAFPLLQVIATTHSPLVLTDIAANESDHVLRLDRAPEESIEVASLPAPVGKDAVHILTGGWFGLATTLDDETLGMMAEHRKLLRAGIEAKPRRLELEEALRKRLGRYAETSVEELVLSVVAELESDPKFEALTHEQIVALREDVVRQIKSRIPQ